MDFLPDGILFIQEGEIIYHNKNVLTLLHIDEKEMDPHHEVDFLFVLSSVRSLKSLKERLGKQITRIQNQTQ
jgi:hypothetical protein